MTKRKRHVTLEILNEIASAPHSVPALKLWLDNWEEILNLASLGLEVQQTVMEWRANAKGRIK